MEERQVDNLSVFFDLYVANKQACKKARKIVDGLIWHIDVMMDYDCDEEVYEGLLKLAYVLKADEKKTNGGKNRENNQDA